MLKRLQVIFLIFPMIFLWVVDSFPLEWEFEGVCREVLDGDTITVNGKRIRLKGIDAPEKDQLSYDKKKIGKWSKLYLEKLILNKKVKIRYREKGKYGRIIGDVILDGWVNAKMIKAGMAVYYSFKRDFDLKAYEYQAKLLRKGIFGTLGFDRPSYYRWKRRYGR